MTDENGLSWSRKADLPAACEDAASAVYNGKIWVMGGYVAGEGTVASVITYDAEAGAWATGPPLPSPCEDCAGGAATIDGGILLKSSNVTFQYKNAVWAEVAGGAGVRGATCGAVLLG